MKYFLQKFWILLFGLLTAHGIPQHENIMEAAEPEYLSPVTPLFVLNTMEDLLSNYMNNNITDLEKSTELLTEIFMTTLEGPLSKMPIDVTSTDQSIFETESTSKVASDSETTTLVSNLGGTERSTINTPTSNNMNASETNSESILQTTENVKMKETSIDTESNRQTDTTTENTKIITSTENIVTSTKMIRESTTFSEAVRTESPQYQPDVTSPSKTIENKNQVDIKSPTPQQSTEPGIDTKSPDQFTTTERASTIQTIMSEPINESQSPSTENIVTSTKTKSESATFNEAVRTEGPQYHPDVTSPSKITENQIDIKPQQSTEPENDTKSPDQFTTTERSSSIQTMTSEPVNESQSPSTENIVTSTKTKTESATFSEAVRTEGPQYHPDVTSPSKITENQIDIKSPTPQQSTEPGIDTKSPDQFTTTERASTIQTIMSEPVNESQSPSTENIVTSTKTKTESATFNEAVRTEGPQYHPDVTSPSKITENQIDIKSATPQQSTKPGIDTNSPDQFTTTERSSSIHTIISEPVTESQSPSIEITSTENDPSVISSSKTTAIEDKTESIESTDKQDNFGIPFHSDVNSKPPTTYGITLETITTQREFEITHESGRTTTVIIPTATTMSGVDPKDESTEIGDFNEQTSENFVFENLITVSVPNLIVANNCSTMAPARHENGTTINYDMQNKTITCNESETETTTIKTTATTTFRPRPAISSISKHEISTSSSTNPTTTSTTKRNSHNTPKESDATTPQIASIILISISFFYCYILMRTYNLRIW